MRVLRALLFILIGIILLYLILAAIGPSELNFERSIKIDAPKEVVWEHVNSLEDMEKWSPWSERDTAMEVSFTGEEGEVGSKYSWNSDSSDVGVGTQEITKLAAPDTIVTKLIFDETNESDSWIRLESVDKNSTKAFWGFYTEYSFFSRPFMLFVDLEKMLETDFKKGLKHLKEWVESSDMKMMQEDFEVDEIQLNEQNYMVKSDTVSFKDMSQKFQEVGQSLHMAMQEGKISATGPMVGLYYTWDTVEMKSHMAIGVPTNQEEAAAGFELLTLEEQPALRINYYGPYEKTGSAHNYMSTYAMKNDIELKEPAIERYVTDPSEQPDTSQWLTEVIYPIKNN
jgi:effector-binding domain-containing protein/uncharacterized protein YndB with AHSA1/START domain